MIHASILKPTLFNWILIDGVETEIGYHLMGKLFKNSNADILNKLDGIPLTPELLKRCGFEKGINNPDYHDLRFFVLTKIEEGYRLRNCDYPGRDIKYLHQLQNLYFALTGEELTIKEPA